MYKGAIQAQNSIIVCRCTCELYIMWSEHTQVLNHLYRTSGISFAQYYPIRLFTCMLKQQNCIQILHRCFHKYLLLRTRTGGIEQQYKRKKNHYLYVMHGDGSTGNEDSMLKSLIYKTYFQPVPLEWSCKERHIKGDMKEHSIFWCFVWDLYGGWCDANLNFQIHCTISMCKKNKNNLKINRKMLYMTITISIFVF